MKKKFLSLLLAGTMVLSLAACGGGQSTTTDASPDSTETASDTSGGDIQAAADNMAAETPEEEDLSDIIPTETVTLDVYDQLANYSGEQTGWFGQIMLEKFNVKLNIIPESDGTYDTRMESGNLGDLVIWGNDSDQYIEAVNKGMLFDWEEDDILADYGSYIKDSMPKALAKNQNLNPDGKIHGFGFDVATTASDPQSMMYTWDLRFDLYQQIGAPEIKDYDDLIDALKQMQEICPTDDNGNPTYGVSLFNDWDGNMVMYVKSTASAYMGGDEFGFGLYDPSNQTFTGCLEENGPYYEALKFYNKLYQEGLLDPDSQTQGYDGMNEDYLNGTAFLNVFNFMGSALYNTPEHLAAGKIMYPVKPGAATPIRYGLNVYGGNRIWSIGANTEYPELCMAIYNWLSTPEGRMTAEYGPKDLCWYYDEDGKTHFTELGQAAKTDIKTAMGAPYSGTFDDGSFKMNNTTWALDAMNPDSDGETYNYRNWASYSTEAGSDIEQAWRDWAGADTPDLYFDKSGNFKLSPGTTYSEGVRDQDLQAKWDQVAECVKTNTWKAIYAKDDAEFESIFADMVTQAKEYGYDECVEWCENEATIRAAAEDAAMADN